MNKYLNKSFQRNKEFHNFLRSHLCLLKVQFPAAHKMTLHNAYLFMTLTNKQINNYLFNNLNSDNKSRLFSSV